MKKEPDKKFLASLERITQDVFAEGIPLHAVTGVAEEELEAMYALAYSYYQQNKLEKAKRLFGFLSLQNGLKAKYWQGLGACCKMMKQYENSIKSYGVLALLEDSAAEATLEIVECYIALNNLPAASDIVQQLIKTEPQLMRKETVIKQRLQALLNHLQIKEPQEDGK